MLIPEHSLLENRKLREACADIWIEALEKCEWSGTGFLTKCPIAVVAVAPECPEDTITHTRRVARLCKLLYEGLEDYFDEIGPCSYENLIASALIHDVGKFWEYAPCENGDWTYSKNGKMFRHPCTGAYLAQKYGLPETVVHAVLTHSFALSPEGAKAMNTPEALILKYVDDMVFNYAKIFFPRKS